MYVDRVIINGYKKIDHADLQFEPDGKYIITGENLDGGALLDSNGTGKTTFLDAIYWIITGKSSENCRADEVVPYFKDTAHGIVFIHNGRYLGRIERRRTKLGETEVSFTPYTVDGEEIEIKRDTPSKMKEVIFNFLFPDKIMYDASDTEFLILNTLFVSGTRLDNFASKTLTPAERMSFIHRLFDNRAVSELEIIETKFKDLRKETQAHKSMLEKLIGSEEDYKGIITRGKELGDKVKEIDDSMILDKENIERTKIEKVGFDSITQKLREEIESYNNKLATDKPYLEKMRKSLAEANEKNQKISFELTNFRNNLATITKKIEDKNKEIENINITIGNDKEKELSRIEKNLSGEMFKLVALNAPKMKLENAIIKNCPACNAELAIYNNNLLKLDDNKKFEEERIKIEQQLKELETKLIAINLKLLPFKQIREIQQDISALGEQQEEFKKLIEETSIKPIIATSAWKNEIQILEPKILQTEKELTELIKNKSFETEKEIGQRLIDLYRSLATKEADRAHIKEEIGSLKEKYKQIKEHKSHLLEVVEIVSSTLSWLDMLKMYKQERLLSLLQSFEIEATQVFNDLSGGEIQFTFEGLESENAKFYIFAKTPEDAEFRSLNTFSSGESRRCGFSLLTAARNCISTQENLFLLLDEALDNLDITGRQMIMSSLLDTNNQIFVVSHISDINNKFGKEIVVTKSEGRSRIWMK